MQENPYCSTTITHGLKKKKNPLFDVTMESYDWTEVFEPVGLYLLSKLAPLVSTKKSGFIGMTA